MTSVRNGSSRAGIERAKARGIETRVERLVALFPDAEMVPDTDGQIAQDSLLNGPQLPAAATNQDDIDALFNSD